MSVRSPMRVCFVASAGFLLAGCSSGASTPAASAPAPMAVAAAASTMPAGVTLAMVTVGDSIFRKGSCQRCHGMDAKGTVRGPDLTDGAWAQISGTYDEIVRIITTGVPKPQVKMANAPLGMNPRGGTNMSDEQIRQVSAYVYSLTHP